MTARREEIWCEDEMKSLRISYHWFSEMLFDFITHGDNTTIGSKHHDETTVICLENFKVKKKQFFRFGASYFHLNAFRKFDVLWKNNKVKFMKKSFAISCRLLLYLGPFKCFSLIKRASVKPRISFLFFRPPVRVAAGSPGRLINVSWYNLSTLYFVPTNRVSGN